MNTHEQRNENETIFQLNKSLNGSIYCSEMYTTGAVSIHFNLNGISFFFFCLNNKRKSLRSI